MIFKDTKNILVIKLRHIGDVLLTVPVFRALRTSFPDAHITALVNAGTEDVLKGNPLIDEVITIDRNASQLSKITRYQKELHFLKQVRKKHFDMTVDLTGGDRAAILSFAAGARYRIGMKSKKGFFGKKYLYTHVSEIDGRKHTVLQNLDVVSRLGITTQDISVDFFIPEEDRAFVKKVFEKYDLNQDTPVVHIHPTSRWLFKCWKDEYMAEIINWLIKQKITVIVTSAPNKKELEKTERILSLVGSRLTVHGSRLLDLCGKTTIKQLGALSEAADLFFGVDSAPMHIAAAAGTPVVALFGPSGAFHWGPWDNNYSSELGVQSSELKNPYNQRNGIQTFGLNTVVQRGWECIPCGHDGCNGSKISKCLNDITPEEIKPLLIERLKDRRK